MTLLENAELAVEISPLGAELRSLRSARDGVEWLWQGGAVGWTGRAPFLFPVVGQCFDDEVELEGKRHPMQIHGFARSSLFTLSQHAPGHARFTLAADDATRAAYPYAFYLQVDYQLEGGTLVTRIEVENRDQRPMPFQFGFHPALAWPLPYSEGTEHCVRFLDQAPQAMHRLSDGIMIRERLTPPVVGDKIIADSKNYIDDAMIFPDLNARQIQFEGGRSAIVMAMENLPDFALWQKPYAPYLCLEPWHGRAPYLDQSKDVAVRPNAITLPAGGKWNCALSMTLRRFD